MCGGLPQNLVYAVSVGVAIFVDNCTQMTWLYLLKLIDEVFIVFQSSHDMIQTQYFAKLQIFRFNNGEEYVNHQFRDYFHNLQETSCPWTLQQNGVAERNNSYILKKAQALFLVGDVPSPYWIDAVSTALHLINQVSSKILKFKTSLQDLSNNRILIHGIDAPTTNLFGCVSFVHLHKNQRTTLDPCAI